MTDFNPLATYKAILEDREFNLISQYINTNFGIKLPDHKRIMIQARLTNRLNKLNFNTFKEYTDYVFSKEGKILELPHMIDVISTNKTDFFRESIHFNFLREVALPEIKELPSQKINIWSAACSSGEEVYTIAMETDHYLRTNSHKDFSILGTDISIRMLEKAKKAIYPIDSIAVVPEIFKKSYLLKNKDASKPEVRIKKELRNKVSFLWHNLMDNDYAIHQEFDIIFCRNVLIYFSKEDQKHVISNLCKKLKSGGYLFLGHSESIAHLNFPLKNVSQTVFQK
ncbi:MAG: methyltransferase domain-containing protein [Bacteroidales bacterium]|nr:methyltransferase domain-containing protein [Bacteroidales bacterium]